MKVNPGVILSDPKINLPPNEKKRKKEDFIIGADQEKIFQYLWSLNYSNDNYITIFTEFEAFFLKNKPNLNLDGIKLLLLGDKSFRGLIEICGIVSNPEYIDHLHHVCSKSFKFLSTLLDHEYNKEADIYIKVYKSSDVSLIIALKLRIFIFN